MSSIVKYTPAMESKLRNVSSLPRGLRCKFLVCLNGENGELIAKQWHRVRPKISKNETLVTF